MPNLVKPTPGGNSGAWGPILNTALDQLNALPSSRQPIKYQSNLWYNTLGHDQTVAGTGVGHATGVLIFVPFLAAWSSSFQAIGCSLASAGTAGSLIRMGIYTANLATGLPETLVVDAGTFAADAVTNPILPVTFSAEVNTLYWLAYTHNAVAAPSVRSMNASPIGFIGATSPSNRPGSFLQQAFTFGSLPTTVGSLSTSENPSPVLSLRAS